MPNDPHITKLEEAVAFNERTIEELSAELAKAYDHIGALSRRIEELESRMTDLEREEILAADDEDAPDPALERPPHSAGPRE
jgi:uncharacterized coiled-coil protein SlyX